MTCLVWAWVLSGDCVLPAAVPHVESIRPSQKDHLTTPSSTSASSPESRPYLFGCGVFWGRWYGLSGDDARAWDDHCFDAIRAMGGTCVTINGTAWADVETTRGVYDWREMDTCIDAARRRGLEIFAYTGTTPDWALPAGVPRGKGLNHRYPPDEQFIPDFERFYEALARRNRGKVRYYEFWNEPNGCSWIRDGCSNGDMAATYVPWLKRWYRAMKRGDPDCILAVGGLDYHEGVKNGYTYLDDIYRYGGGDFFDHVAIHPYGHPLNWQGVRDTYACLVRHGDGRKKLWINEYGWNTTDEEEKARFLTEVLDRLQTPEYSYVFHACYLVLTDLKKGGHDFGLCDADFETLQPVPRRSYTAFASLRKPVSGVDPPHTHSPGNSGGLDAPSPDGRPKGPERSAGTGL